MKADHIDVGMTVKEAIAVPRFIYIKAAKVGLNLECASAVKDELTQRGYQVVGGNPESFGDPPAIVIHGACQ